MPVDSTDKSRVERCLDAMIQNPSSFQHCIFVGPPGCGKTTAAWSIAHQFYKTPLERVGRALFLNASDERSLEAIRSKVYPFAESAGSGLFGYSDKPKIIISGFSVVIKFLTASWFRRSKSLLEAPIKLVYPLLDNTLQIADPTIPLWPAIYILEFKFIY